MHFRRVKDILAAPLHWIAQQPDCASRSVLCAFRILAKAAYFLPRSYVRRTVSNFCGASDRSGGWGIYSEMVSNLEQVGLYYAALKRHGRDRLVAQTVIDPSLTAQYERFGQRQSGLIFLVPHCAGALLSSAGLSTLFPTVLLVRESRSATRREVMMGYLQELGVEFILTRNAPPTSIMRQILRCLRDGKVIVGTTDTISPAADTLETQAFGQRIYSPSWPARVAKRLGVPIVPGFIHMQGDKIRMLADEGYVEPDIQESTQRWVSAFERWFRRYPSDWVFMLDKRWAGVLAAASAAARARASSTGARAAGTGAMARGLPTTAALAQPPGKSSPPA